MSRTTVSLDPKTAMCLRYLANQERRSASNLVKFLVWEKLCAFTDHWKPEEVEQLLDSFEIADLQNPDGQVQTA
jgi:hypothetical protein